MAGVIEPGYNARMEFFWWALTLVLMAIGLIGTVLPVLPGTRSFSWPRLCIA
jgi:uncharacterized membrane protein YbaN (DUF454 family)